MVNNNVKNICLCMLLMTTAMAVGCSSQSKPSPPVSKNDGAASYENSKEVSEASPQNQVPDDKPQVQQQKKTLPPLSRQMLDRSLELGRGFLLRNQKEQGNFRYQYHLITGETTSEESQVRQAGALWGLALVHQDHPSPQTKAALERGFAFFEKCSHDYSLGGRYIAFPGAAEGRTGTMALVSLALIEYLRAEQAAEPGNAQTKPYQQMLDEFLTFLVALRRSDAHFHRQYRVLPAFPWGDASPYFDGESLLALTKAALYLGREDLKPMILQSAEAMHQAYAIEALKADPDSSTTKSFYQWGTMVFFELSQSDWPDTEVYATRAIDLAHWMIDVHRPLEKKGNTAYSYEGLISAWELARRTENKAAEEKIGRTIETGLSRLTSWQVSGPSPNSFLSAQESIAPEASGGVMNAADDPWLRIDVTQHQMHAVILARRYIYK